jgi:hypothetical protein
VGDETARSNVNILSWLAGWCCLVWSEVAICCCRHNCLTLIFARHPPSNSRNKDTTKEYK